MARLTLLTCIAGCGVALTHDGEEAASTREALGAAQGDFDFEQPLSTWTPSGLTLAQSDVHASGSHSAQVGVVTSGGTLTSAALSSLGPLASVAKLQLRLPRSLAGQSWQGQLALRFNAPSIGVWDQYVGPVALQNAPVGEFVPVAFALPASLVTALSTKTYADLKISIEFDFPATDARDPFYLDAFTLAPADTSGDAGTPQTGGISDAKLSLTVSKNLCQANSVQDFFEARNDDRDPIALSDISIKYWINDKTGSGVDPHVWYGGCVTDAGGGCVHSVANVSATATPFASCAADATHDANWEITISTTDPTPLAPGNAWSHVQTAVNLADWRAFDPGPSAWYSGCGNGEPFAPDSHFAVYVKGNLVAANGIAAPSCRSPHGSQTVSGVFVPPASPVVGRLPADKVLSIALGLPVRNAATLRIRAEQASDPNSTAYRKWVSPAEMANSFLPTPDDYAKLVAWAQANGLTAKASPNRVLLDVSGTVAQLEKAVFVNLITAQRPDGSVFFGPDRLPSVDLDVTLLGISGLDNYVVPKHFLGGGTGPIATTFQSSDFRGAYLGGAGSSCSGLTGEGQSIGIFTIDAGVDLAMIHQYETNTGLTNVPEIQVQVAGDPDGRSSGCPSCTGPVAPPMAVPNHSWGLEAALDVEMAVAMAPRAQVVVFEGTNVDQILQTIALNPQVSQVSSSWTLGVTSLTPQLYTLLAAQGQSFFTASGDNGGYAQADHDAIGHTCYPFGNDNTNAMPFVTMVGGTDLDVLNHAYVGEAGWNGSGGGVIPAIPMPAYQANANTANAQVSTQFRNAPDVAMPSENVYMIGPTCGGAFFPHDVFPGQQTDVANCTGKILCDPPLPDGKHAIFRGCKDTDIVGTPMAMGGTSAASPLWAAYMALVNEANKDLGPSGFINPAVYAIGKDAARYAASFHDVTAGSSAASCDGKTFSARAGYDLVTGWGSPSCGFVKQMANKKASLTVRSTITQSGNEPVEVCGDVSGFSANGQVQFTFSNVPAANGPLPPFTIGTLTANAAGDVKFDFSPSQMPSAFNCLPAQTGQDVTVTAFDVTTGSSLTGKFPGNSFCINVVMARDFNGGCP